MLLNILTPKICELCGCELIAGERTICTACLTSISPTGLHREADNALRARLPRTAPIATVGAFAFYTHDAPIATLIRRAKYNNRPDIVERLARIYTQQLIADKAFSDIDLLQAVPMHRLKRLRRGYNQAQVIAATISKESGIPTADALRAIKGHKSQTKQIAAERINNVNGIFALTKPEQIHNRHIAIIDDILTTGATLSEAVNVLMQAEPAKISIFTLASTPVC